MAKQRIISTKFWDDTYIMGLNPIEKLLFLYFLTNPLTNVSGIYEISTQRISFDTGIDREIILKTFDKFEKDKKMIYRDGWICIINFIKNQNLNPSISQGIARELQLIPKNVRKNIGTACPSLSTPCGILNLTKLNLTKLNQFSSKKPKRYFRGEEMRFSAGKWWVLPKDGGEWLEFAGQLKDTELR